MTHIKPHRHRGLNLLFHLWFRSMAWNIQKLVDSLQRVGDSPLLVQSCCQWPQRWLQTNCRTDKKAEKPVSNLSNVAPFKQHLEDSTVHTVWYHFETITAAISLLDVRVCVVACVDKNAAVASILWAPEPPSHRGDFTAAGEAQKRGHGSRTAATARPFTYCRAWRASSPRSTTTTGTRWRNFSAGRRLNPWPRCSTTNSCCPCLSGPRSQKQNRVPTRPPREALRATHPRSLS